MKKFFKGKGSSVSDQAEPDMAVLIEKIEQKLVVLEKKLDILISQSSEKPYSKPSRSFDRSRSRDRGKSFTKAICADCNKECEIPFKPTGDRPVYCKDCFSKHNAGKERDFSKGRRFDKKTKPMFRKRKERA